MSRGVALVLAGGVLTGSLVVAGAAPSAADEAACGDINDVTQTGNDAVEEGGAALEELQIEAAHVEVGQLTGKEPGEGVTVAVLDAGIVDDDALVPTPGPTVPVPTSKNPALEYYHGTAVAGLINGAPLPDGDRVGIAPAAAVVDVRIHDVGPESGDDDSTEVTSDGAAQGLQAILPRITSGEIDIVTMAFEVDDTPELAAAVAAATAAGAVVVAASGDRTEEGGAYEFGEDAVGDVFPAGYVDDPLVVAASSTPTDGAEAVDSIVQSSAIDVAVPTAGGVSYAVNGTSCLLPEPSTSFAAAEVSGVLALLMTVFGTDADADVVRRLEETATGSTGDADIPDKLIGHGVVQPLEALTRPISREVGGGAVSQEAQSVPATVPEPAPDVLESTRRNAVWWGLLGGAALVVAVLLRPVLSRRR